MSYLRTLAGGLKTLVTGLGITLKEARRKPITLQYPREKPELSKAYRSAIKLKRFEDTQTHDCVACLACVHVCPSYCIAIDGDKVEGLKKKRATKVEMDFALCSLCGLCIDVCPTDTLEYSKLYDEAGRNRTWVFDLLKDFRGGEAEFIERQRALEAQAAAEKEAQKAAAAAKAKADAEAKAAAEAKAKADAEAKAAAEASASSAAEAPSTDVSSSKPNDEVA